MNFELESKWRKTIQKISKNFDEQLDIQAILFLIGLQELNIDIEILTKDQKIEVIHVGLCTILSPYVYYTKMGVDNDGWPHFENVKKLPNVEQNHQEQINLDPKFRLLYQVVLPFFVLLDQNSLSELILLERYLFSFLVLMY